VSPPSAPASPPEASRPLLDEGLPAAGTLALAFAGFCTFLDLYATQPLLPLFERIFAVSKAEAALTVSAPTAAVALVAPVVGALADRASRKSVMVVSILALALFSALAATSRGLGDLVVWRFLQGAAIPGMYVIALAYVSEEAGPGSIGRVMASFVTGNVLGGFSGRLITGLLVERAGWRAAFVCLGAVNLAGALATAYFLPPSRHFLPRRGPSGRRPGWHLPLLEPRLLATLAVGFAVLFSLVAPFTYVVFYLSAPPFSLGPTALSALFVVYLVGAVVTPVAGRVLDRVGSRRMLIGALLAGMAGALLTLVPWLPAIVLGLALLCSAAFVAQSASTSFLRVAAAPSVRSLASGLYVTSYYAGGSAGGLLPGLLWSRAGWTGCVALVVGAQLVTIALALRWWASPAATTP
jgi:predicted MFS family arabinose efflux permease